MTRDDERNRSGPSSLRDDVVREITDWILALPFVIVTFAVVIGIVTVTDWSFNVVLWVVLAVVLVAAWAYRGVRWLIRNARAPHSHRRDVDDL